MRRLYLLVMIFIGFTLTSCAIANSHDQPEPKPQPTKQMNITKKTLSTTRQYLYKNPLAVQVYPKGTPLTHPYKILAKETVSNFNKGGVKRQEASIRDTMRTLAASVGGDAVINITRDNKHVTGLIVSFENNGLG